MNELEPNILRYFYQYRESMDYLDYIDANIFVDITAKALFQVYLAYVTKYKHIPDKDNVIAFMRFEGVDIKSPEVFKVLVSKLDAVYIPFVDLPIVEEFLLLHIKKLLHTRILQDSLLNLGDSWSEKHLTQTVKKLSEIDRMDIHGKPKDMLIFSTLTQHQFTLPNPKPTCLNNFNAIIGMGGFFAPQLVSILGGPKSMKTTLMLRLAAGYVKDGLPVTYIDWENGNKQIITVLQQIILHSKVEHLYADYNKERLDEKVSEFLQCGNDLQYIKLRPKKDKIDAAELIIDKRFDETGIKPDAIFYDYLDITGADKGLKDRRERVQAAYADASSMNNKYDAFGITISKLTSGSSKKDYHDEDDAAEDKEKAYNVDAMFSLHRTADDITRGIGWLQPILQRVGESRSDVKVALEMDGATRYIADSDLEWDDTWNT